MTQQIKAILPLIRRRKWLPLATMPHPRDTANASVGVVVQLQSGEVRWTSDGHTLRSLPGKWTSKPHTPMYHATTGPIAAAVNAARKDQGVTLDDLTASTPGVSYGSIRSWLAGDNPNFSVAAAESIMAQLGVTIRNQSPPPA